MMSCLISFMAVLRCVLPDALVFHVKRCVQRNAGCLWIKLMSSGWITKANWFTPPGCAGGNPVPGLSVVAAMRFADSGCGPWAFTAQSNAIRPGKVRETNHHRTSRSKYPARKRLCSRHFPSRLGWPVA